MSRHSVNSAGLLMIGVSTLAMPAVGARGDCIDILGQIHNCWGHVEEAHYNALGPGPVWGGCTKTIGTDLVEITSNTLGSDMGQLCVEARATSEEDYMYNHGAEARTSYLFRPDSTPLTIDFTGMSAHHWFESGLTYALLDLTLFRRLDVKSWENETGEGWVDDVLPYTGVYDVDITHIYFITISAYAHLGDQREGYAWLTADLMPEPGSAFLLLVTAGCIHHRLRRRA
jgi:hypothetical protein